MKRLLKSNWFLLVFAFTLFACNGPDEPKDNTSFEGKITSFQLRDQKSVFHDMVISANNTIAPKQTTLPAYVNLTKLTAIFETDGTSKNEVVLKINDKIQVSKETVNDFTNELVYDLYVNGEKLKSYTVTAPKAELSNDFLTFTFPEKNMESFQPEIDTEAGTITVLSKIPMNVSIKELKPVFTVAEERYNVVKVNGEVQKSGISSQDFSNPVVYMVEGEDGSAKSFTVRMEKSDKAYLENPIIKGSYADPTVVRVGNEFFVYVTSGKVRGYRSKDLVNWSGININNNRNNNEVFSSRPNFTDDNVSETGMWAPDINYFDGKYVMYYSISKWSGGSTCGIGVGVSSTPEGYYYPPTGNPNGKLFVSSEIGVHNSIDPCFFEENGKRYLFWGSFYGIYMTELTANGMAVKDISQKKKVAGDSFEAAYVHKKGNYYYLFVSAGTCCEEMRSTYCIMVGRSTKLEGPYLDKNGKDMTSYNTGYKVPNTYQAVVLKGDNTFGGPGHNSRIITDDNGVDWMLYHAYVNGENEIKEGRQLMIGKVNWDKDGWPIVDNGVPSKILDVAPVFN